MPRRLAENSEDSGCSSTDDGSSSSGSSVQYNSEDSDYDENRKNSKGRPTPPSHPRKKKKKTGLRVQHGVSQPSAPPLRKSQPAKKRKKPKEEEDKTRLLPPLIVKRRRVPLISVPPLPAMVPSSRPSPLPVRSRQIVGKRPVRVHRSSSGGLLDNLLQAYFISTKSGRGIKRFLQ